MKKKIIVMLIIINIIGLIIVPICSLALTEEDLEKTGAGISEAYKRYMQLPEEERSGFMPRKYNVPFKLNERKNLGSGPESLPVSYVLTDNDIDNDGVEDIAVSEYGNLPMKIKDQNPYGLCWAFTSLNSLETNLAKKGMLAENGELYDFSEWQMDYTTYYGFRKPEYGVPGYLWRPTIGQEGNFYQFLYYVILRFWTYL